MISGIDDEEEKEEEDVEDDGRQNRLFSVTSSSSSSSSAAWTSELFLLPDEGPPSVEMWNCSSMQLMDGVDWGSGLSDLWPR